MNRDDVIKMLDNAKTGDIMVVSWIDDYELKEVMFKYDGSYEEVGSDFKIYRSWIKTATGEIRPKSGNSILNHVDLSECKKIRFATAEEKMTFIEAIKQMEKKDALVTAVVLRFDSKQVDVIQMRLSADEQNPSEISRRINDIYNKEHIAWASNVCDPDEEVIFNFINEGDRVSFTLKK
jgi:hypothetical protein